jgi:mRNA-degrading endonuclease RelE of RelBE toxin-antitoxin system
MPFHINFEDEAVEHLDALAARERTTILGEIEKQLVHQPHVRTKHRKQLRPNPLAKWQLSVGGFRIFYDIDETQNEVVILAIGTKVGNRLIIGRKEYKI